MEIKELLKALFPHLYLHKYKKFAEAKLVRNRQLKALSEQDRISLLESIFIRKVGYELNLAHPQSWCEKLQWLKLYDATLRKSQLTDKISAKKIVSDIIGKNYVVPIIFGGGLSEINFKELPNQFVIKANHGSGCNFFVKDKKWFLNSGLKTVAETYFKYWLQMDYGFDDAFELHYSAIKPQILVEPYYPKLHEAIEEYRFMCFEGEPVFVKVKSGSKGQYRNLYDMNWTPIYVKWGREYSQFIPKPSFFDEMKALAEELCKGFHFVRVDFNFTNGQILFGEMTFTSGSGFCKIEPLEFDLKCGTLIQL